MVTHVLRRIHLFYRIGRETPGDEIGRTWRGEFKYNSTWRSGNSRRKNKRFREKGIFTFFLVFTNIQKKFDEIEMVVNFAPPEFERKIEVVSPSKDSKSFFQREQERLPKNIMLPKIL